MAARHTFRAGTPHHEADRVATGASANTVAQSIGAIAGPVTRLMAKLGPRSVSRPYTTRTTLARGTDSAPQWSGREHGREAGQLGVKFWAGKRDNLEGHRRRRQCYAQFILDIG